jgi:hypothetical protein
MDFCLEGYTTDWSIAVDGIYILVRKLFFKMEVGFVKLHTYKKTSQPGI